MEFCNTIPLKADIHQRDLHVRFVPKAAIPPRLKALIPPAFATEAARAFVVTIQG
jgi:carbohydrate-selective porin OprB